MKQAVKLALIIAAALLAAALLVGVTSSMALFAVRQYASLQSKQPEPTTPVVTPDGKYESMMLPCKCGGVVVYVPGSCVCFDVEHYPDLVHSLNATYVWCLKNGKGVKSDKPVGRYETITLNCGCALGVFVPKSSGCLAKKYPELAALLDDVYRLANKYKEKQ